MSEGLQDDIDKEKKNQTFNQMVNAEGGSIISDVTQYAAQGDIIFNVTFPANSTIVVVTEGASPEECAYFEDRLKEGSKRKSSISNEEDIYVEPTLLWQHDIEQSTFLQDPDARDAWLNMTHRVLSVSPSGIMRQKYVLIVGDFYAGKTRLLQHMYKTVLQQCKTEIVNTDSVYPIPIFVPLRGYHNPPYTTFLAYLQHSFREAYDNFSQSLHHEALPTDGILRQGHYLFLFDGLDELAVLQRRNLLRNIQEFVNLYPRHLYVFSSRRSAYGTLETLFVENGFTILLLTPFSRQQVQRYLQLRRLTDTSLGERLLQHRDLFALTRVPGLLKLLCDIGGETGDLPPRLSTLYENVIHSLLTREIKRDTAAIPYPGLTRSVLNSLAFEMTRLQRTSLSQRELETLVWRLSNEKGLAKDFSTQEWIDEIRHREILISDEGEIFFQYRTWQEYFTACVLAELSLNDILEQVYVERGKVSGFNPIWYPVLRFLTEMRPDLLETLYAREEIIGARCTPLDANDSQRQRAFEAIYSSYAKQGMSLYSSFNATRDFYNDRQICIDLNPPGAVAYLTTQFYAETASPATKDDALGLLVDYAAGGNDEAMEIVVGLLPNLLSTNVVDAGLRETAAYAVSKLSCHEFIPQLLSHYDSEENEHVRKAILWSLATLDPEKARTIFSTLLLRSLGAMVPDSVGQGALKIALPRLLNDKLIYEIREHLLNSALDIVNIPEQFVELLIKHNTGASQELLYVLATHFLVHNLTQEDRVSIYEALAVNRVASVRYLLAHTEETYVNPFRLTQTLAFLLDEPTLLACISEITTPTLPRWIMNQTYWELLRKGKQDIAEKLVQYRDDIDTTPIEEEVAPVQETLSELLSQPDWRQGKAFSSRATDYIKQADTLSAEQREQLEEYVVEMLNKVEFAQLFKQMGEHEYTYSPYILVCLMYAATLHVHVTPELYRKLLSVDFNDESVLAICNSAYTPERNEDILFFVRSNVPEACLVRAAELCGNHRIIPHRVVPLLGNVIKELCAKEIKNQVDHAHLINRLIQVLSKYGSRGAVKLEHLIGKVHDDCSIMLAKARLMLTPPSIHAESAYLKHLVARTKAGNVDIWDRELQFIQTPAAIPLLFELLQILITTRPGSKSLSHMDQTESSAITGVATTEMKSSILLTYILDALTRLASDEVLQGYERLMSDFPGEQWLNIYYENARRVYLANSAF
jgi:hypothetical protein